MSSAFKEKVEQLLSYADIRINGSRPWDIQIHDGRFYNRVLANGSLGLGESYMDGWWDCDNLDQFFFRIIRSDIKKKIKINLRLIWHYLTSIISNKQTKGKAKEVIDAHYDLGNELFETMLDAKMVYTCGYWKNAANLDQAQANKLDLVCRKLKLKPGMRILDIG